jgi:hypothetical protein
MSTRNTNQVATYLPQNVSDQLKDLAARYKWSAAQTARIAIVEYLQRELAKSVELEKI